MATENRIAKSVALKAAVELVTGLHGSGEGKPTEVETWQDLVITVAREFEKYLEESK